MVNLKNTLIAASVASAGILGVSSVRADIQPVRDAAVQTVSASETVMKYREADFRKNYRYLYDNLSGAWFSFGDEKLIRDALYKISKTPEGREIIALLPDKTKVASSNFVAAEKDALYQKVDGSITLNTDAISSSNEEQVVRILSHELRHAVQDRLGLWVKSGLSVEQSIINNKLLEAETHAWDLVRGLSASCLDEDFADRKNLKEFMERNLVAEERELCKDIGSRFDEADFKKTNEHYLFQQALRQTKDVYKAQTKMAGYYIKCLMGDEEKQIDPNWRDAYDRQALNHVVIQLEENKLTKTGDPKAFNRVLSYFQNRYGLKRSDIDKCNLGEQGASYYGQIKSTIKEMLQSRHNIAQSSDVPPPIRPEQKRFAGQAVKKMQSERL